MGRAEEGPDAGWAWSFSMHGPTEFDDVLGHDLPAKIESASWIACISDYCRTRLQELVAPSHWSKMSIVRMGVDSTRFLPVERTRVDGDPLRVLFVGRLVPEKGPDVLIDAAEALYAQGIPVELSIAGGGVLAEALERKAQNSPAADTIRLLGPVGQDDIRDWYAWADVFCLPSFAEGVPVVLMEAMSMELPVVSTPIAGIPELIRDGESGILVPPGRVEELAQALSRLSRDPALRRDMGAAGRRRVLEEFQPQENAERLLFVMQSSLHPDEKIEGISA
jgi:glycosyltransferase involved in cell wall biosynthesis